MNAREAILKTLAYHSIFKYPLTKQEIHKLLIGGKTKKEQTEKEIELLTKTASVEKIGEYHFLKGQKNSAKARKKRKIFSNAKFKRANLYSNLLKLIPTIELLALTGALSMQNSTKDDDIDFLIITSKNKLWTTRFLANLILLPFKRSPKNNNKNNKACLNIFIETSDLSIKTQNIYTAHEVAQVKVLWDKNGTYEEFIRANKWVQKFLPNWVQSSKFTVQNSKKSKKTNTKVSLIELFLKKIQIAYMKKKKTTEEIGDRQLFFHPKSTQNWVLDEFKKLTK